ncbi:MAG TPA: hypothetical protein VJ793_02010 [Anaerolineae bacterium]|nr:hypothetical protein [Anaerolineae bacterium]
MQLPVHQVDRFYSIWRPLLFFANEQRNIVPSLLGADETTPLPVQEVVKIRDAIWADDSLREAFIAQNPARLPPDDLALADSWKYRRQGTFFVFRHLKKHSIFIDDKDPPGVFEVVGLYSPIAEVVGPYLPVLVKTVLLPFEDQIIYDSLMAPYPITFGGGIRGNLKHTYEDAKERGDIITSLLPPAQPARREDRLAAVQTTDAKVLDAFRKHLYQSGLSPQVVDRDVASVTAFATDYLANQPEPHSLREIRLDEVEAYLSSLSGQGSKAKAVRRQAITAFKRFFRFLRDTDRIDYMDAEDTLRALRQL